MQNGIKNLNKNLHLRHCILPSIHPNYNHLLSFQFSQPSKHFHRKLYNNLNVNTLNSVNGISVSNLNRNPLLNAQNNFLSREQLSLINAQLNSSQKKDYVIHILDSVVPKEVRIKKALWVANVYRFPFFQFAFRLLFPSLNIGSRTEKKIVELINDIHGPEVEMIQRFREGGLILYFDTEEGRQRSEDAIKQKLGIEKVFKVNGTPYIDDLLMHSISSKLLVEFEIETMNVMDYLFNAFRNYGRISSIEVDKKAKKASINFMLMSDAASAKNCLHGSSIHGAGKVIIYYDSFSRIKLFIESSKSPKYIPLFAILISLIVIFMVEPFRLLNVIQKLAMKSASGYVEPEDKMKEVEMELSKKFSESAGAIYFVTGAPGSGKSTMLHNIVNSRKNSVVISCLKSTETNENDESHLIERLEEGLHFTPSFHFVNSVISYIEPFLPKSTNSMMSNKLQQLQNILRTLDNSLKILSTLYPSDTSVQYPYALIVFDQFYELIQVLEYADDKKKAQQLFDTVIAWAVGVADAKTANIVFVCDNPLAIETFNAYKEVLTKCWRIQIEDLDKDDAILFFKRQLSYTPAVHAKQQRKQESEAKEAAVQEALEENIRNGNTNESTTSNNPQNSVSFSDILRYVFFKRLSKLLLFGLFTRENNKREKGEFLNVNLPNEDLDYVMNIFGGRIADLVALSSRLSRNPDSVKEAVEELIFNARSKVLKDGFGVKYNTNQSGKSWTHSQFWKIINAFENVDSIPYDNVLFKILDGDDAALKALIHSNLLGVEYKGDMYVVKPHSPLYHHVYKSLIKEDDMFKKMIKLCREEEEKKLTVEMKEYEEELYQLSQSKGDGVYARVKLLNHRLEDATNRFHDIQAKYKKIEQEYHLKKQKSL